MVVLSIEYENTGSMPEETLLAVKLMVPVGAILVR